MKRAALLALLLPLVGCGTFHAFGSRYQDGVSPVVNACNIVRMSPCERIRAVYGGSAFDVCVLGFLIEGPSKAPKDDPGAPRLGPAGKVAVGAFLVVDLPHSFAVDTFFLPFTAAYQLRSGDLCPPLWSPHDYEKGL